MSSTNGDGPGRREDYVDGGIKPLTPFDPARIGPYLLLGRLGAGGMGRVFLARSDSGRTVAVKVVHEEHVSDARFRARFRREIEAAGRVAERFTAPVLDAGPDENPPWVATGYVPGLSLEQVVRWHGPLPTASVHTLADGLLQALKDIHDAGIVHRDLKPSNVMLTVDGTKVIDFGIARALETSVESLLTSTGMVVGSPGFMSPEQVRGQSAGPASDVFTVGCVLTYAATGRLPFGHGASNQHAVMYQIVQDEPDLEGIEDPALRTLVARCLTKDPEQRPGVDALLADPERVGPESTGRAWLPADVVTRLAQQAARLLDAEVRPLREEPADRPTVGLRPKAAAQAASQAEPPVVVRTKDDSPAEEQRERHPRRRRTAIALPVIVVLTVGGGTLAVLQPWSDGGGVHAQSPGSSASPAPGGSNSPDRPGSSPSKNGKTKDKGDADGAGKPKEQADASSSAASGGTATASSGSSAGASDADSEAGGSTGSSSGSSGSSGTGGGSGSGSGGSSAGSPPPAMKSYKVAYTNSCVGACSMPIKVSWSAMSRATRYDVHYTNKGSNFTKKNVDTVYSTANTSYTINGPFSGDKICVAVRAANKHGASAWAETWCGTVAY
ncbi:serine/threonine protein kinase [Streptomyces sp. SID14478]|uniref:serine/threonine protein kinase n=1 Tax=Streptomyces sp. SID14478 TaxID=2706073 RepID=UPI0013DD63DB|nr:serine/threonine-protein kinase [Streptomyces sp. SID14478]NEB74562.1 serine/threonine protein kinase [Streptomyces sp. SID14478]